MCMSVQILSILNRPEVQSIRRESQANSGPREMNLTMTFRWFKDLRWCVNDGRNKRTESKTSLVHCWILTNWSVNKHVTISKGLMDIWLADRQCPYSYFQRLSNNFLLITNSLTNWLLHLMFYVLHKNWW